MKDQLTLCLRDVNVRETQKIISNNVLLAQEVTWTSLESTLEDIIPGPGYRRCGALRVITIVIYHLLQPNSSQSGICFHTCLQGDVAITRFFF